MKSLIVLSALAASTAAGGWADGGEGVTRTLLSAALGAMVGMLVAGRLNPRVDAEGGDL